jgi:hypothetical protein
MKKWLATIPYGKLQPTKRLKDKKKKRKKKKKL